MTHWRLDGPASTLILSSDGRIPAVVYWGPSLSLGEDLDSLVAATSMDISGGVMDVVAPLSLCPQALDGFLGHPGLILHKRKGKGILPQFKLDKVEEMDGQLVMICVAKSVSLRFEIAMDGDVLSLRTTLHSENPVICGWLAAPVLPLPQSATETIEISGKWTKEFQEVANPITQGSRVREARGGRPGHETFPGLIVDSDVGCYGFHYADSNGHRMITEELPDGRRQVQFGKMPNTDERAATGAASFRLYASFGSDRNAVGANFQRHLRAHAVGTSQSVKPPRPVHYNCWEAVYFNHKVDELKEIATRAAELGAERFVLDDGWFGVRDDDTSSLGDWTVDPRKYPDGLGPLVDHVTGLGMRFGIWFEPEMVNKNSDLYRAHPDWALGPQDQALGRGQMVLNMNLTEVEDYLFEKMDAILSAYEIDYVKWDHNRKVPLRDQSATRAEALAGRLKAAHPHVDFESCASGGARIAWDLLLKNFNRVWLSDSNDALERFRMQIAASTFLPNEFVGSHVGPRHCHTSGRILPMQFRAWVAASRHMGFEMDPRELDEGEAEILKRVTAWYKDNRDWLHNATIQTLPQDDPARMGEIQVSERGDRFVAMAAQMDVSAQNTPRALRLTGLEPDARYQLSLRPSGDTVAVSRGDIALRNGPVTLTGQTLMTMGTQLPFAFPATMWVIEGTRL